MKTILVILAHPKKGSFNHAIAETAKTTLAGRGHRVIFHDLYEERFDPVFPAGELDRNCVLKEPIKTHCGELVSADGIIVVHPNWWGQPPAILKGWVDRVIRQGVAYRFGTNDKGEGVPVGLLKAVTAVVFTTSNTFEEREKAVFGDPLENLWQTCIFDFCEVKNFFRKNFGVMIISTPEERRQWLLDVARTVEKYF